MTATKAEAYRCWRSGVELMAIGVGGEVRGDMMAVRELRTLTHSHWLINHDTRPRRLFLIPYFESLGNTRQLITDALCNNNGACASRVPCQNGGVCSDVIDDDFVCRCPALRFTGHRCQRRCSNVVDVVFAIDKSGSVPHERFQDVISFFKQVVSDLEIAVDRTRVAALSWSDSVDVDFRFHDYVTRAEVLSALDYIRHTGGLTNTAEALNRIRMEMFVTSPRPSVIFPGSTTDSSSNPVLTSSVMSRVAVVMTDGNSNVNSRRTVTEAVALHQDGVHVITVSVGRMYNESELRAIASRNGTVGNMFRVDSYDQLPTLASSIPAAICDAVDECEANPCQFGGRCVNGLSYYTCLCSERRTGYNCQRECWRSVDLALVLDMSGSTEDEHQLALKLARRLVEQVDVGRQTRVALLTYGNHSTTHFNFNTYRSKAHVLEAMNIIPEEGRTNTQDALLRVRTDTFTASSGARESAEDAVVLITDARSNVRAEMTQQRAAELRQSGVTIYVIGLPHVDVGEARGIAGNSGILQLVRDEQHGERVADVIAERLCRRP